MKHFKLFSTFLAALLISSAAIFNACSKQETEIQTSGTEAVQMSQADIKFQNQLVAFKSKLDFKREHPGYKSGELMSVDSAIYLMEALFNYTYGFPEKSYKKFKHDTCIIILTTNSDGMISLNDINLKYLELKSAIQTLHYNSGFLQKRLLLASIEKGEVEGNTVELDIYTVTGELGGTAYPFEEGDDWWYGHEWGRCDETPGSDTIDASELIEINVSLSYIMPPAPPGYHYTYAPEDIIEVLGNDYVNPNNPTPENYLDYLLFYATQELENYDECLEHEEMNFYVESAYYLITSKLPEEYNKPSNWLFMGCDYQWDDSQLNGYSVIQHKADFTFGLRYLVQNQYDREIL